RKWRCIAYRFPWGGSWLVTRFSWRAAAGGSRRDAGVRGNGKAPRLLRTGPVPLLVSGQLVAILRRRDLERVDELGHEQVVSPRRGHLDYPLRAMAALERVEQRLIHAVPAHGLPHVVDDVPLVRGELARVAFR